MVFCASAVLTKNKRKTTHFFGLANRVIQVHTDDSIGVAPAARLSADWELAGGVAPRWRAQQADYY